MATQQQPTAQVPASEPHPGYTIEKEKKSRWWKVLDPAGELVCLTVYRKGAREVVRRLGANGRTP